MFQGSRAALLRLILGSIACAAAAGFAPAQSAETVLHSFTGGTTDGAGPTGLIFGAHGALYGTTVVGGSSNDGTVFKLTPPVPPATLWTETVLYSFTGGTDGIRPNGVMIFAAQGALYGTTGFGGNTTTCAGIVSGCGVVFKLTPPAAGQTRWTETVLHRFTGGTDGGFPGAGLTFDDHGALYGTTAKGGKSTTDGTVFKLTPPAAGKTQWTETVLHSFRGTDGARPYAALIFDAHGALYGTTTFGGNTRVQTQFNQK